MRDEPVIVVKKLTAIACLAVSLCATGARASTDSIIGSVAVPTFGSPALARLAYQQVASENGTLGEIISVTSAMHTFSLSTVSGPTGLEDFDIFFYATLDNVTEQPLASFANPGAEHGDVPAGARYAVITMSAGVNGTFDYSYS